MNNTYYHRSVYKQAINIIERSCPMEGCIRDTVNKLIRNLENRTLKTKKPEKKISVDLPTVTRIREFSTMLQQLLQNPQPGSKENKDIGRVGEMIEILKAIITDEGRENNKSREPYRVKPKINPVNPGERINAFREAIIKFLHTIASDASGPIRFNSCDNSLIIKERESSEQMPGEIMLQALAELATEERRLARDERAVPCYNLRPTITPKPEKIEKQTRDKYYKIIEKLHHCATKREKIGGRS